MFINESHCFQSKAHNIETSKDYQYCKGYIAGYRDGVKDGACGKTAEIDANEITTLPISIMTISTRARNALSHAGCTHVADVVAVSEEAIGAMRNLGAKTASEIANWLAEHGIHDSAWSKYL